MAFGGNAASQNNRCTWCGEPLDWTTGRCPNAHPRVRDYHSTVSSIRENKRRSLQDEVETEMMGETGDDMRKDAGKVRLDLVPADALWELGKLYTFGATKYEPRGWEKGMAYSRIIGAMKRHLEKLEMGSDYDTGPGGSGCHHGAAIAFGAFALMAYHFRGMDKEFDDRAKNPHPDVADEQG